jgi:hypothetical protein
MEVKLGLTLREECWLRAFENRVMRKIFSSGLGEVTVLWELHNEQLCDLYSRLNII